MNVWRNCYREHLILHADMVKLMAIYLHAEGIHENCELNLIIDRMELVKDPGTYNDGRTYQWEYHLPDHLGSP